MSTPRDQRPYDLVLFGATGFTGQLVAEYLASNRPSDLRWALAGRSRGKLEGVRTQLLAADPSLASLPLLVGDSENEAEMAAIAAGTRVVCTTAGPYAKYGRALVSACAESGTDYCDLTGEVQFVRDTIDRLDARARETGARIVPSCGFDSLPSDLGVHLLHAHFASVGRKLAAAKLYVLGARGGPSGGTIASMMNLLDDAARDPRVRALLGDPYALNPDPGNPSGRGPDGPDQMGIAWDRSARLWTAPFVMAAINTRVVRRSNALLGFAYGRDFRYTEVTAFKKGPRGLAMATGLTAGVGLVVGLASLGPLRSLAARIVPQPGTGPSKVERDTGFFRIMLLGTSSPDASGQVARATARVEARQDPGYGATSRMLAEAALCLATDELPRRGGVLTPAVCMGDQLVERLRRSGMVWSVEEKNEPAAS